MERDGEMLMSFTGIVLRTHTLALMAAIQEFAKELKVEEGFFKHIMGEFNIMHALHQSKAAERMYSLCS